MVDAQFSTPEWTCVADDGEVFCESKETDVTADFREDGDIDIQSRSELDVNRSGNRVLVRNSTEEPSSGGAGVPPSKEFIENMEEEGFDVEGLKEQSPEFE